MWPGGRRELESELRKARERLERLERKTASINQRLRFTDMRLAAIRKALRAGVTDGPRRASMEAELKIVEDEITELVREARWDSDEDVMLDPEPEDWLRSR